MKIVAFITYIEADYNTIEIRYMNLYAAGDNRFLAARYSKYHTNFSKKKTPRTYIWQNTKQKFETYFW
jgi:hypothetical protein